MPLELITAPLAEPVTLDEAKGFMRVDSDMTEDDALIRLLISGARRYAELWTQRSFITQAWRLTLDGDPCGPVRLERGPVTAVTSIQYLDMAAVWQTITNPAAPEWAVALSPDDSRLAAGFGYTWPQVLPQIGSVRINYTAGYGASASSVPQEVRNWILIRVSTAYNNREEVVATRALQSLPYTDRLLDQVTTVLA